MRARRYRFTINGLQADKAQPVLVDKRLASGEDRADAVLLRRYHARHAQIPRGDGAVQLIAGDMPLLNAHDAERFGAVRRYVIGFAGRHQRTDHGVAIACRNGNFIGEFAGEGNAEQPRRRAAANGELAAGNVYAQTAIKMRLLDPNSPVADGEGSTMVGNKGFDPLGFATSAKTLRAYREAELKHGRLAMLAALGWPVSELLQPWLSKAFGAPDLLAISASGLLKAPSVLNGGLDKGLLDKGLLDNGLLCRPRRCTALIEMPANTNNLGIITIHPTGLALCRRTLRATINARESMQHWTTRYAAVTGRRA